jgi:hypothetical protein
LKSRFCEVHFRETRAGQGFWAGSIKKFDPEIWPINSRRPEERASAKIYFGEEFNKYPRGGDDAAVSVGV